LSYILKVLES